MPFQKGNQLGKLNKGKSHQAWNKGKKLSAEHIRKLSISHIGIKMPPFTEDHKRKIGDANSISLLGNPGYWIGKKHPHSEESKNKISSSLKGEKSYRWKGGITPMNVKIRTSVEYRNWRHKVFQRDDYRCIDCGERGGKLEADHIYQFSKYPSLRFEVLNGQTLCESCHKEKTIFERTGICAI